MRRTSSSPLSIATLKRHPPYDDARWDVLFRQIQELELEPPLATWMAGLNAQLGPDPYVERLLAFAFALPLKPWSESSAPEEPCDLEEAFLRHELQVFINRTDAKAQERDAVLDTLAIPQDTRKKIHELCFIPGVVFEWCAVTTQRCAQAHKTALEKQQRLRSRYQGIQRDALWSTTLKARAQHETDVQVEFLQLLYPPPAEVEAWRKQ